MFWLADGGKITEEVTGIEGLPGPTKSHQNERLVTPGDHHGTVGLLSSRKYVRRHVFTTTPSEHVYHLEEREISFKQP